MRKGFLLAGLLALGGCFEEAPPRAESGATAPKEDVADRVKMAAQERLRDIARDPEALRFRAMELHRQAMADTYAVCGQATVMGSTVFIPFVSVVNVADGEMKVEQHVGRSNIEATRVYVEMVGRCFDGGGPMMRAGGTAVAQPTPPLPTGLPILEQAPPEPPKQVDMVSAASPAPANEPSGRTLVMRQNGNVRAAPGGGGEVLRVARTGAVLNVFGTAPGGWYRVGDTTPEGWVHGSLVSLPSGTLASMH
ncbi:SH3 domain-containing protein [Roseomonas xinghualingensis]|uniref:SH3 domain-containing protein n=1 Tax=Roseomonas xinghualingensis TaxID=2986475 RepID=UPI0021F210A9|nr:SH3 domain-containing protein [Roseomonas sp. SXEYE001]MCV4206423.1 SH3 domain-containing protein [Roseomonas sp. SXEYE001]